MNKVLVLTGPTAAGKTGLSLDLARHFEGEIINADSRQLYRHMDIGTAKPTSDEQQAATHHLIDIATPDETITLAQYQALAYEKISEIQARGKLPMLVGGTGMYITAVMDGWRMPEIPPNPELRAELEAMSKAELVAKLAELDPEIMEQIDQDNPRRLVRALEVCIESGQPFSELRRKRPPGYDALHLALTLEPREKLYERADLRLKKMLAGGWLDETRQLLDLGYDPKLPSMTALGYPQMVAHLRDEISLDEAETEIKRATRKYIRRQYTWLRGHDPGWEWITHDDDVMGMISGWLAR